MDSMLRLLVPMRINVFYNRRGRHCSTHSCEFALRNTGYVTGSCTRTGWINSCGCCWSRGLVYGKHWLCRVCWHRRCCCSVCCGSRCCCKLRRRGGSSGCCNISWSGGIYGNRPSSHCISSSGCARRINNVCRWIRRRILNAAVGMRCCHATGACTKITCSSLTCGLCGAQWFAPYSTHIIHEIGFCGHIFLGIESKVLVPEQSPALPHEDLIPLSPVLLLDLILRLLLFN
mmetsp:Transcript_36606/g.72377  ORF Transcript_36606/g.72377 Transcript_36606/m.72377 type:complete len:231 (-) Transcript_36606:1864-2556(-)